MNCLNCLINPTTILVADASVIINLLETQYSKTILDALPNQIVISVEVGLEIRRGQFRRSNNVRILEDLITTHRIQVVEMGDSGAQHFENLVGGTANESLDDGESATIAIALEQNAMPLIDERKANNICKEKFPKLVIGCSVDIFAHKEIEFRLGREKLAEAVFNALYYGRMRVMSNYLTWVVDLIGPERAEKCCSLPKSIRATRKLLLNNTSR